MIGFRVFIAFILAFAIGFCYHRSWNWEHGKGRDSQLILNREKGLDTTVFMPGTYLIFLVVFLFCALILFTHGRGIYKFSGFLLNILLLFSIYFICLYPVIPWIRKRFSARACAMLWLIPVFVFYNAFASAVVEVLPVITIHIPKHVLLPAFVIWGVVAVGIFGYHVVSNYIFTKMIKKQAWKVLDFRAKEIWNQVCDEIDYHHDVNLIISPEAKAPFSMGYFSWAKYTVIPDRLDDYNDEELYMIFSHELHHLQRSDVNTKIFLVFLRSICWFNPLMWIATKKAAEDIELSCDEIVVENMTREQRLTYAKLLLSEASVSYGFTTNLSAAASTLRYRMKNSIEIRKGRKGTVALAGILFICYMCQGLIGFTFEKGTMESLLLDNLKGYKVESVFLGTPDMVREEDDLFDTQIIDSYDEDGLMNYLGSLTVEKLETLRDSDFYQLPNKYREYELYVYYDNLTFVELCGNVLHVMHYGDDTVSYGIDREAYYRVADVDWNKITECLNNVDG